MEEACIQAILPVWECSMSLAGTYSKACGRSVLTAKDFEYALKYSAMNLVGKKTGSFFPEIYENESDSDDSDEIDTVDEDEEPFTRYEGQDEFLLRVNHSYDNWESWEPQSPIENMLKNAIDKNEYV